MITLEIYNTHTRMAGKFSPDERLCNVYHNALRMELSYAQPNAQWSPAFKEGKWDGRISLYNRWKQTFPTGLLARAVRILKIMDVEFRLLDKRKKPEPDTHYTTTFAEHGRELRFYQTQAAENALQKGRGIIAVATGGGKTIITAEIIRRMGVSPVVFVVPSRSLLKQTVRELEKYLRVDGRPTEVGYIGDSVCRINMQGVNVITYHTALAAFNERLLSRTEKDPRTGKRQAAGTLTQDELAGEKVRKTLEQLELEQAQAEDAYGMAVQMAKRRHAGLEGQPKKFQAAVARDVRKLKNALDKAQAALQARLKSLENKAAIRTLIESCKALLVDEAHIAAVVIESIGMHAANAYYRQGLSATPWREDNQEIRIEGTMGRLLIQISASDLIDLGYLVPCRVFFTPIEHIEYAEDYNDAYAKHITHCWERNWKIKCFAEEFQAMGRPVLILVKHLEHGRVLEELIKNSVFVQGSDNGNDEDVDPSEEELDYRKRMLNACERNETILIATSWAYTGVDAPAISVLIMADPSAAASTTLQKVGRVLRCVGKDIGESIANGKPEAVVIDFWDSEKHMHDHAVQRRKVYKLERRYKVTMIK